MRRHHGGRRTIRARAARPGWATRASHVVGPGQSWGFAGAAVARHAHRHLAAVQPWRWIVFGTDARRPERTQTRERPDQRDRDTIGIRVRHSPPPSSRETQPWNSASDASSHRRASKEPCMHNPDRCPKPPARQPAAAGQGRSRARRPRPGPPGFTYEVQLLGGEAGRRLAQEQTEAVAAVLAWLAGHPPTPPAATGPAATDAIGKPVGQSTATPTGTRPTPPSPAGAADASTQPRRAGAGVRPDTQAEGVRPLRRAGHSGGWRVVVEPSRGGSGPGRGAGGSGPAGWGGRTGAGRAPGGGAPLGLACLAPVGDRHGPNPARQP
jgi:hypothetical protein